MAPFKEVDTVAAAGPSPMPALPERHGVASGLEREVPAKRGAARGRSASEGSPVIVPLPGR